MSLVLLVRHGRTNANATGILAGQMPGIGLDDVGVAAATGLCDRLHEVPLAAAVSSPLERARQTADIVLAARLPVTVEPRLIECDYGEWAGEKLDRLRRRALWPDIQNRPSTVTFPGGESFAAMQDRAVAAIRERDAAISQQHGADAVWIAFSHADVIKAIVTDAIGAHLDRLQRIVIDPCSVTAISYTPSQPLVHVVNATGADPLAALAARLTQNGHGKGSTRRVGDEAVLGGGPGAEPGSTRAG